MAAKNGVMHEYPVIEADQDRGKEQGPWLQDSQYGIVMLLLIAIVNHSHNIVDILLTNVKVKLSSTFTYFCKGIICTPLHVKGVLVLSTFVYTCRWQF